MLAVVGQDAAQNAILSRPSAPIILIDTPSSTANGDGRDRETQGDGQASLRWRSIEEILGNTSSGGKYTLLYRAVVDTSNLHHSHIDWRPKGFVGEQTTIPMTGTSTTITGLLREHIYAIQLRYEATVNSRTVKVFAGRDVFVWPSLRAAGGGERVATFPLRDPVNEKTYAYHICSNTFPIGESLIGVPEDFDLRGKARIFIRHALERWQSSTQTGPGKSRITMKYIGTECADYSTYISAILHELRDRSIIDAETAREHVRELIASFDLTEFTKEDRHLNEVIYMEATEDHRRDVIFADFSRNIGLDPCGFGQAKACAVKLAGSDTTDILLPSHLFKQSMTFDWDLPPIAFEECTSAAPLTRSNYATVVHEAGHALGIRGTSTTSGTGQPRHHAQISDSVMKRHGSTCSPTPFDVMAIYSLYQAVD